MPATPFFPPFPMGRGFKDIGPNGPVRFLQNFLFAHMSELAKAIGLDPDGDYGNKTISMVAVIQYAAFEGDCLRAEDVTGNFDLVTRTYLAKDQHLYFDKLPMQEGGGCMYVTPDSPEPKLWPPAPDPDAAADSAEPSEGYASQTLGV